MSRRRRYLIRLLVTAYGGIVAVFVVSFFVLRYLRVSEQDPRFESDAEIIRYLAIFASLCFAGGVVTLLHSLARKRIERSSEPAR